MKKYFNFTQVFSVLLILLIINARGGEKVESQRLKSSITIDGKSIDWTDYRQFYNEDWKTVYAIANDDNSLSIMIQFREDQLARKINTRGFTIWLNSEGNEEKSFGIHYEDRALMESILNNLAEGKGRLNSDDKNSEFNKTVELRGTFALIDEEKNVISDNGQNGIYAKALYDQGIYCFEYKVTFDANEINPELFNLSLESELEVGAEIAAVSEEFKEIMQEKMSERMKSGIRPGGGMSGGMRGGGRRGGGRRGGGMDGSRSGGRENMAKDMDAQEIWFSVELSK